MIDYLSCYLAWRRLIRPCSCYLSLHLMLFLCVSLPPVLRALLLCVLRMGSEEAAWLCGMVMLSLSELRDSSCWEIAGEEVKGQREILLHFSRRLCSAVDLRVHCMHPHQERLQAAMWAALGDKSQLGQVGAAFQQ